MEKEEKEVKKVTRKTTTTKKTTVKDKSTTAKKKETKKSPTKKETAAPIVESKKTSVKKVASKTAEKKAPVASKTKKVVKKATPVKKVAKEEKVVETPAVNEEKIEKVITKPIEEQKASSELLEIRKKRYIIETIIVAVVTIIVLVLLCNKTFLRTNYKTDDFQINIPRFTYYVSDKNNTVKFSTLRKSDYLKEYYNEYLEGFIFYSCAEGNNTFYYNEKTKTLIKEIKIEKKFIVKTIEVTYDSRTPEEVCGLR